MITNFKDLKFGYASAEVEGANEPLLLLDGYFNQEEIIGEARNSSKFLFLGYKGSGKSAIGEHLRLIADKDDNLVVTSILLADFPYTEFKSIIRGDIEVESKYTAAWTWLLLLYVFNSISQDDLALSKSSSDLIQIVRILRDVGLLPLPSLQQVVMATSKRSFRIKGESTSPLERNVTEAGMQIPFFIERMKSISQSFKSSTKHIIIIDGLDDILSKRQVQYDALAALLLSVGRLNLMFQQSRSPIKIILLCRTDLYERLPGANKNKTRQDSAINLDWYHDPRNPQDSNLINLVNLRAKLVNPQIQDIFTTYFPRRVEDRDIRTFLLDLTRHTPRDFVQLLRHIQEFAVRGVLSRDEVLSGVRSYSINYFLPEIRDELVGYLSEEDITYTTDLIGSLRKRDFRYSELEKKAEEQSKFSKLDIPKVINLLFECSAIGNVHNRPGGTTYYTFKFRNRNSTLNLEDRLILHRGMWKALNLV